MRHDVTNLTAAPVQPSLYLQLQHDGNAPPGDSFFMPSYTGPTLWTPTDKYQKLTFEDIEKGKAEHATKANDGWVAMSQHFFVSAFIPAENTARDIFTKKQATNLYAIGTVQPLGTVAPGATVSNTARLYSGPQDEKTLETITPGLELVKDYGMFAIIAKPMFWIMDQIHKLLGNWGWTIIAFTILIKLVFFPLSAAGYRSMAKMSVVTPKMQAIRERYKADPVKMQQATMELYKTEKINPLGGCLPILVQMPVFMALYYVLQASVEMRGAPWIGWIHDLTQPDPCFILPVLYAGLDVHHAKAEPAAGRPDAGEDDAVHAAGVLGHVRVLPVGPGAVLGGQQPGVDRAAVGDHQEVRNREESKRNRAGQEARERHGLFLSLSLSSGRAANAAPRCASQYRRVRSRAHAV